MMPKVVIYGAGVIAQELVRLVAIKGWELAAVVKRPGGDAIGQDIGELAGLGPIGVLVQSEEAVDFEQLGADIAFIAATDDLSVNFPIYKRFLTAGINVLCHGCDAYHPRWMNPTVADKIHDLAVKNNVTFSGGGIWDSSRIWSGIVAAGPIVELESISLKSQSNTTGQGLYWAEHLGAGLTPEEYDKNIRNERDIYARSTPIPSVYVLQSLGYTVNDVVYEVEPVIMDRDLYCKTLDTNYTAGTVLGTRFVIDVRTQEGVTARTEWDCRVYEEGEDDLMLWKIQGTPSMELSFVRKDPLTTTASSLLNRTYNVLGADPGIVELVKFGPLSPTLAGEVRI